ncbi:hypothetical protein, partial [Acetobacter syzygii]
MVALTPQGNQKEQEARERLLSALHDAGIGLDTPLGILIMSQAEASAAAKDTTSTLLDELKAERLSVQSDLTALLERLDKGFQSIQSLQNTGEARLKEQEIALARDQQALFDRFMASLEKGLKEQTFERIRERLPTQEYTFYREARWHAYARLALMAGGLILMGACVSLFATWDQSSRGRYCLTHTYHDSKTELPRVLWRQNDPR